MTETTVPHALPAPEPGERNPEMMLKDKVGVVYGAGGAIGGAVARAFASEGAKLFVTGASGHRSTRSLGTSFPLADPPMRRRSTHSTSRL